jgi:putative ABC transport system permease protein
VVRLVLRQGLLLTATGLTLGIAGALAVSRVLESLLFEIPVRDPATWVSSTAVLALAALAACYLPARKAASLEPVTALRQE